MPSLESSARSLPHLPTVSRLTIDGKLRTDFTWVLSGNAVFSACQWAVVLLLAKLGNPEMVGSYALGMAVSAPIILFANFQLRALLVSDVDDHYNFEDYLAFRLITLAIALLVVLGVAFGTQRSLIPGTIILLIAIVQALECISDTYYGLLQRRERMDRISCSLIAKGLLSLLILGWATYVTHSIVWAVNGLIAGRLLVLLQWDSRLKFGPSRIYGPHVLRLQWNTTRMMQLLRSVLPLGAISGLISLNAGIPRYFIEAHCGNRDLGIFSATSSLLSAGTLLMAAFGQSIFYPVAKACKDKNILRFRTLALQAMMIATALGGVAIFITLLQGRAILGLLFKPEYGNHADLLVKLMLVGTVTFIVSGQGYVMTAARWLKPQIPLLILGLLSSSAACAWLIPRRGIMGAADAMLIAALIQLTGGSIILILIDRQLRLPEAGA
jgi:O-antigen/teichoic acid export membrane protein